MTDSISRTDMPSSEARMLQYLFGLMGSQAIAVAAKLRIADLERKDPRPWMRWLSRPKPTRHRSVECSSFSQALAFLRSSRTGGMVKLPSAKLCEVTHHNRYETTP